MTSTVNDTRDSNRRTASEGPTLPHRVEPLTIYIISSKALSRIPSANPAYSDPMQANGCKGTEQEIKSSEQSKTAISSRLGGEQERRSAAPPLNCEQQHLSARVTPVGTPSPSCSHPPREPTCGRSLGNMLRTTSLNTSGPHRHSDSLCSCLILKYLGTGRTSNAE